MPTMKKQNYQQISYTRSNRHVFIDVQVVKLIRDDDHDDDGNDDVTSLNIAHSATRLRSFLSLGNALQSSTQFCTQTVLKVIVLVLVLFTCAHMHTHIHTQFNKVSP